MDDVGDAVVDHGLHHILGHRDVVADELNALDLLVAHHQFKPVATRAQVKDGDRHALAHKVARDPGPDTAQRPG